MKKNTKTGCLGCGGFLVVAFIIAVIVAAVTSTTSHHHSAANNDPFTQSSTPRPTTATPKPQTSAKSSSAHHSHHPAGVVLTSCHARDGGKLPDPHCTPGATYARVTQANIASTICASGWTDTVRPSESYTERLKVAQIRLYGLGGASTSGFEEDHLIPLELGGAPYSPKNLWPERGSIPNPKDSVEDALNSAVCDGTVSLAAARHAMATNWETAESVLGVSGSGSGTGGGGATPAPAPTHHHHSTHAAPAPPPAPTHTHSVQPTGCYPKTSSGNCYSAGEFCSDADHGMSGVAENGEAIKCEGSGSETWHWEPA